MLVQVSQQQAAAQEERQQQAAELQQWQQHAQELDTELQAARASGASSQRVQQVSDGSATRASSF